MTLIFDPSRSSKVKSDGANRKLIGTFLYDLCWVKHRISHPSTQPTNQPLKDSYIVCRNRSSMQYSSLDLMIDWSVDL